MTSINAIWKPISSVGGHFGLYVIKSKQYKVEDGYPPKLTINIVDNLSRKFHAFITPVTIWPNFDPKPPD